MTPDPPFALTLIKKLNYQPICTKLIKISTKYNTYNAYIGTKRSIWCTKWSFLFEWSWFIMRLIVSMNLKPLLKLWNYIKNAFGLHYQFLSTFLKIQTNFSNHRPNTRHASKICYCDGKLHIVFKSSMIKEKIN